MELYFFNTKRDDFTKSLHNLLAESKDPRRRISKSYTKDACVLCISHHPRIIGVDVELQQKRSLEAMEHFVQTFSTFEIKDVPDKINEPWFYKAWTAMEGYFKLSGKGFSAPKNFLLDLVNQSIWQGGIEIAWFEYYEVHNYLICLCSNKKFSKQNVSIYIEEHLLV